MSLSAITGLGVLLQFATLETILNYLKSVTRHSGQDCSRANHVIEVSRQTFASTPKNLDTGEIVSRQSLAGG